MADHARIGFRMHTGWAVLVALSGESPALRVLRRYRLELLPAGSQRFVYHSAAQLPLPEAAQLIESVRRTAEEAGFAALQIALQGLRVSAACIPTGASPVPDDLAVVLASHARIHAAEGALYAGAVAAACRRLEIPVITRRERDIWGADPKLRARIDALRKTLGPPWSADHKIATAAALCCGGADLSGAAPSA